MKQKRYTLKHQNLSENDYAFAHSRHINKWLQHKKSIYYFVIDDNGDRVDLMEYNIQSEKTKCIIDSQEIIRKRVNLINEEETHEI